MKKLFAILILPLCVSAGMMMHLPATAQVQNTPSAPRWERIVFSEPKDLKALVKMYPIVKGPIEEAQRNESRITTTPQTLQVQTAVVRSRNVDLLFLFIQDALLCGSHGCDLTVYVNEGSGYKKSVSMVTFPSVYLSTGGSPVSLIFCGSLQGGGRWNLKNIAFVFVGPSTCPAITPRS